MNKADLDQFLEEHKQIEWRQTDDGEALEFRNINLPWYQEDDKHATRLTIGAIQELKDGNELLGHINRGLDVTGITRITGYFSVTKNFNKGKVAELKERYKSGFLTTQEATDAVS